MDDEDAIWSLNVDGVDQEQQNLHDTL
jgi:hypothetical protein